MKRSPLSAEAETPKPNGLSVRQKSYGCMLPAFLFLKSNREAEIRASRDGERTWMGSRTGGPFKVGVGTF